MIVCDGLLRDDNLGLITVHVRTAGVGSEFPAASVARAEKVCAPGTRPVWLIGLLQAAKGRPSSEQSKPEPVSDEVNSKLAEVVFTCPYGLPVIVVSGGVVSGGRAGGGGGGGGAGGG